jgi:hypothetical protein
MMTIVDSQSKQLITAECVYCLHQQKVPCLFNEQTTSKQQPYIYLDQNTICQKCNTAGSFYYDPMFEKRASKSKQQ